MQHLGVDPIGKVLFTEIQQKYMQHYGTADAKRLLCDHIKKLFPGTKVANEYRKELGKKVTVYRGIYWKCMKSPTNIDWTDIYTLLPRSSLLLSNTLSDEIRFALPSNVVTNGSIVMKEIMLEKKSTTWMLQVRGRVIGLEELGICHNFSLTKEKIEDIINAVNAIEICTGLPTDSSTNVQSGTSMKEMLSTVGNETSMKSVIRSSKCEQILTFTSQIKTCKKCRDLKAIKNDVKAKPIQENVQVGINAKSAVEGGTKAKHVEENACRVDNSNLEAEKENIVNKADEKEVAHSSMFVHEEDHSDLSKILESVFPNAPHKMKILLASQRAALLAKHPTSRRWSKEVISMCLSLWVSSPKSYTTLTDSGMLILPSGRQLRRYKNCIPQEAGINNEIFHWMHEAAKDAKIPPNGWSGGLHHDETKVQSDLILDMTGGKPSLVGWIDLGEEAFNVKVLKDQKVNPELATEVIQLSFVGYTGFRFPICHFPTNGIKASELNIIIWNTISKLSDWGFTVDYIMQDGGEENRSFMNMHFNSNPLLTNYGSQNLIDPTRNIYHTQDFSHNIKKLRNSLIKSGNIKGFHTRQVILNGKDIVWKHWEKAVEWDRNTNPRRILHKITDAHLNPNISEKMRNSLAEEMLDKDFLHLMKSYAHSLSNHEFLDSSIKLLEQTSQMISIFRDNRLITSISDSRLETLKKIYQWFLDWENEINQSLDIPKTLKSKSLPSRQCLDDILNMLSSFPAIVKQHLSDFACGSVKPSRFNNDVAENVFCQEKGMYNGNNGNPTYFNYSKTVNSIILGQSLKSRGRKSNAGLESVKPFASYCDEPPTKKPKKLKIPTSKMCMDVKAESPSKLSLFRI